MDCLTASKFYPRMRNQNISDWTKEQLLLQDFESVQSSSVILNLIETSKQNNLDSEKYI